MIFHVARIIYVRPIFSEEIVSLPTQNINRINFVFRKIYIHIFTYVYLIEHDLLVVDYW